MSASAQVPLGAALSAWANVHSAFIIAMERELKKQTAQATIQALRQQLEPHVTLSVFPATDASATAPHIPLSARAQWCLQTKQRDSGLDVCTLGAVGCADSHVRLLEHIARSDADRPGSDDQWTLVFESDAQINPAQLRRLLDNAGPPLTADDNVCMIVLGTPQFTPLPSGDKSVQVAGRPGLMVATGTWYGTHALLVRNRHAAVIAAAVQPLEVQIDGAFGIAACLGHIPPVWLSRVNAVRQNRNVFSSSIQTDFSFKAALPSSNKQLVPIIVVPYVLMLLLAIGFIVVLCLLLTRNTTPPSTVRKSTSSSTRKPKVG